MNWVAAIGAFSFTYAVMPFADSRLSAAKQLAAQITVGVCAYFLWGAR
jgi:hypothetical protein